MEGGKIELILGPMFSGKTTEMIKQVRYAAYAKQSSVIVKYLQDNRYTSSDVVAAHSELRQSSAAVDKYSDPIRVVSVMRLAEVVLEDNETVVGVDEGHFYPDLAEVCERWADSGRRVIVAALDSTYMRGTFDNITKLIPLCENIRKENGVCMQCRRAPSAFSKRIVVGGELFQVGGRESYISVCRRCFPRPLSSSQ
jgi:thymidine kinase